MDTQELRTLRLLEELENEKAPSQRDLASRLNISLGLVNSFIKRLAHKGYFKITTVPRNRVKYILTPKGAAEKTRLTYEYISYSFQFYKNTQKKLNDLFQRFEKQKIKKVIFFGAGELAEIAYASLRETDIVLVAIADREKIGEKKIDFKIVAPDTMPSLGFEKIVVTTMEPSDSVLEYLLSIGISRNNIEFL